MEEITVNARLRANRGKGSAHRLRSSGSIPGVFYLGHTTNFPIELNAHELQLALRKKPQLLLLKLDDGSDHECVVRELQRHPVSGRYLHVDLMGIVTGQKMTVKVPVELVGSSPGVRLNGGVLQHSVHMLNVECLPRDIPQKISADISNLNIGNSVHVRDLVAENFRILDDPDTSIATVLAPRIEKVAEPTAEAASPSETPEVGKEDKESEES
jgi:large subunit ribosomal protein L25